VTTDQTEPGDQTEAVDPLHPGLDALGYGQALDELESILAELETGDVDIDRLADRVRRAAALVNLCRGRLAGAQLEVTRILSETDDARTDDGDADPSA